MKRISTLAAVTLMGAGMMYAAPRQIRVTDSELSMEKLEALTNKVMAEKSMGVGTEVAPGMKKISTGTDGSVWSTTIKNIGTIQDVMANPGKFEDLPLYLNEMIVDKYDTEGNETVQLDVIMVWPSYAFYMMPEGEEFDEMAMVTLDVLSNNDNNTHLFSNDYGTQGNWIYGNITVNAENYITGWNSYSIISQLFDNITQMVNGKEGGMCDPASGKAASSVEFVEFDTEDMVATININVNASINGTANVRYEYFGEGLFASVLPASTYKFEINQPHIFNLGNLSGDDNDMFEDSDWGPVTQYYFYLPVKPLDVFLNPDCKVLDTSLHYREGGCSVLFGENVPANEIINPNYSFFQGAFFAAADSQSPEGIYNMLEPESYIDPYWGQLWLVQPEVDSMLPFDNTLYRTTEWNKAFGVEAVWGAYFSWSAAPTTLEIGTNNGLLLNMYSTDGNTLSVNYTGKIVYHYDPKNAQATKEIEAVGNLQGGVDDVEIDGAAAPVYYNMQGIRVANPEKGQMVIVREGNKASKRVIR